MKNPEKLSDHDFLQVVQGAPLVSMDLVIKDPECSILLGLRTNEPARGFWFLPGGRILKGESLERAFARVTGAETGMGLAFHNAELIGVFQHFYDSNFAGIPHLGTHYVSLAYVVHAPPGAVLRGDRQHAALQWWTPAAALQAPAVHGYTCEIIQRAISQNQIAVPPDGGMSLQQRIF